MRLARGADHAGCPLREALNPVLDEMRVPYDDVGTTSTASVDYPDIAEVVARAVADGRFGYGVLVCGTGTGMAMAASDDREHQSGARSSAGRELT